MTLHKYKIQPRCERHQFTTKNSGFKFFVSPDKKKRYLVEPHEWVENGKLSERDYLSAFKIVKGPRRGEYWLDDPMTKSPVRMEGKLKKASYWARKRKLPKRRVAKRRITTKRRKVR
jgi:hypothetical protein